MLRMLTTEIGRLSGLPNETQKVIGVSRRVERSEGRGAVAMCDSFYSDDLEWWDRWERKHAKPFKKEE
jgi:hypothetical protein